MKASFSAVAMSAALLVGVSGCTTIQNARGGPGQRLDPWENWNRKVFAFNEDLDTAVLKPVATVYSNVMPQPVRNGISNFFGNAADAWSAINNVLQGKFELGVQDATRFRAFILQIAVGLTTFRAEEPVQLVS